MHDDNATREHQASRKNWVPGVIREVSDEERRERRAQQDAAHSLYRTLVAAVNHAGGQGTVSIYGNMVEVRDTLTGRTMRLTVSAEEVTL